MTSAQFADVGNRTLKLRNVSPAAQAPTANNRLLLSRLRLQIAEHSHYPSETALAAREFAEAGQREEAARALARALEMIQGQPQSAGTLSDVARTQWTLGDVESSRKSFVRAASLSSGKNEWLVAVEQAKYGDAEGAIATAKTTPGRDGALGSIAEIEVRAGHLAEAISISEQIEDVWERSTTLAVIAAAERQRGNARGALALFAQAFDLAGTIDLQVRGSPSRAGAWRYIADQQGASGGAREAILLARDQTDPPLRIYLLMGVVDGLEAARARGSR